MAQHAHVPDDSRPIAKVVPLGPGDDVACSPWEWDVARDRLTYARSLVTSGHVAAETDSLSDAIARVHPADREIIAAALDAALANPGSFSATYRVVGADGRLRLVENRFDVVVGEDGRVQRVIGAVRQAQPIDLGGVPPTAGPDAAFLDAVLDNLGDGVLACSRTGVPILVNGAARTLYESASRERWDDSAGRDWLAAVASASATQAGVRAWRGPLDLALEGTPVRDVEVPVPTADGRDLVVRVSAHPIVTGPATTGAVVTLRDVTAQKAAESLLRSDALSDRVTRLPNRRSTLMRLAEALAAAEEPVGIVDVDVDGMPSILERHGFDVGDEVVRQVAGAIAAELTPHDFLGHVGTDELAVVVTERAPSRCDELAARISRAVADLRTVRGADGEPLALTVSIGVALVSRPSTPESAMREAESAARDARVRGSSIVVATQAQDHALARALETAIEEDELVLHYQPKVDVASSRIVGAEALVRWMRPGHGMVSPAEFIPLAETTGLIVPLGEWVLRTACRDARNWLDAMPGHAPVRLAVNVSPRQFDASVTRAVEETLTAYELSPEMLTVEVTESVVMRDVESAISSLRALRDMGVGVSVDDFGTGYSSLSYLRRLPVDELKVDRSFVTGLADDRAHRALVGGIVSLAHALDLTVVAEGVETEQQLDALATVGCDVAQGFLLYRPMDAGTLTGVLADDVARRTRQRASATVRDDMVVVADDADEVRLLARMTLAVAGFEVHDVDRGDGVVALVRATRAGVVILDVNMPGADGFELCRLLRADPATADCTIVMLTATDAAADKVRAFSAGADDYIVKPFAPRDLVARVRAAQRRRARGTEATG